MAGASLVGSQALPLAAQGNFGREGDSYACLQTVHAVADGGTLVQFRIERSAVGEPDSGFVSISGYVESR